MIMERMWSWYNKSLPHTCCLWHASHIWAGSTFKTHSNALNTVQILITVLQGRMLQEVKWLLSSHKVDRLDPHSQVWLQRPGSRPLFNMNWGLAEKDVPITCLPKQETGLSLASASLYSLLLLFLLGLSWGQRSPILFILLLVVFPSNTLVP